MDGWMDEEASNGGEVRCSSNKQKTRTVPLQRRLVVQVVAHDGGGVVEQVGYLVVVLAVGDDLLGQVDVIPAAGLDQLLLHGGALYNSPPHQWGIFVSPCDSCRVVVVVGRSLEGRGGRERTNLMLAIVRHAGLGRSVLG